MPGCGGGRLIAAQCLIRANRKWGCFAVKLTVNAQTAELRFRSVAIHRLLLINALNAVSVHFDEKSPSPPVKTCVPIFPRDSFYSDIRHFPLCLFVQANPPRYLTGVRVRPTHRGPRTT